MSIVKKLRKMPYGAEEFFNIIWDRVKDEITDKELIDYASPMSESLYGYHPMEGDIEFTCHLAYGGIEGIYLTVTAQSEKVPMTTIGTVKSLRDDDDAFAELGRIFGLFVAKATEFMRENSLDFEYEGTLVRAYDEEGKQIIGAYIDPRNDKQKELVSYWKEKYPHAYAYIYNLTERTVKYA